MGGLNLTHSQNLESFLETYGPDRPHLEGFLQEFGPEQVGRWAESLGVELFTGTSGRRFPVGMTAGPLVQRWLEDLQKRGVEIRTACQWTGWTPSGEVQLRTSEGLWTPRFDALILALGGPTWPALGTGGSWVPFLTGRGIAVNPWRPANCGWEVTWSSIFKEKNRGHPIKDVVLTVPTEPKPWKKRGELLVTDYGLEGGLLYAAGRTLYELRKTGSCQVFLDLVPDRPTTALCQALARAKSGQSVSTLLQKSLGLSPVKISLLRELWGPGNLKLDQAKVENIKFYPLEFSGPRPLDEAISAAGGVSWEALDSGLQLKTLPGVWCVGEMVDWEAPTGGYLLTACLSMGFAAGRAVAQTL